MSLGLDEAKAEANNIEKATDALYNALRIIWLAILASVIALFIVTRVVAPGAAVDRVVFWIFLALGVVNFGLSFVMKQSLMKNAREAREPGMVRTAYIIAFALCESIAIFGLIAHLLTGVEYYYFLFVLGGFGILLHKPQRDDVLSALAGGGIWEARKNQ
jgi:F0F1-type ATP synthase membrane subunit c/vacuolar-type H+-ATPase subunit K